MKSFLFNGKEIKITKDGVLATTGIMLIGLSAILLGLFAWANFIINGNFDKQFWLKYIFTLASVLLGFFGMLITVLSKERKKPNVLITKQKLKNARTSINKNNVINQIKFWLKWVHNYSKRVDKLQELIILKQEKLKIKEKPEEDLKSINIKLYEKLNKAYNDYIIKKDRLNGYLEDVEIHYKIVEDYKTNEGKNVKQLKSQIKTNLLPKVYRSIEEITYTRLFNTIYKYMQDARITINYYSLIMKNILPKILIGAGFTLLATSIIPEFRNIGWQGLITLLINISTLMGYLFIATTTANNIVILENIADENKLIIIENFKEDLVKFNGKNWEEIDERDDIEPETTEITE